MAQETYTEVTTRSWRSRLGGAFKGIVFGFVLVGIAVLWPRRPPGPSRRSEAPAPG